MNHKIHKEKSVREKNLGIKDRLTTHHRERKGSSTFVGLYRHFSSNWYWWGKKGIKTPSFHILNLLSNLCLHHQEAHGENVT